MSEPIRSAAMEIIVAEERAKGRDPQVLGSAALEKQHGCDLLSFADGEAEPRHVEVKGWGVAFLAARGSFNYPQDLRASQMEAAQRDEEFRVEIVANLAAYLDGVGLYERLTLTAAEVRRARPRLYEVPLAGKESEIERHDKPPVGKSS